MSEPKTQQNNASVEAFIRSSEEKYQQDCFTLVETMERITGKPATMWGTSIVGFDSYNYQRKNGWKGEWMRIGFSPRKQNLTLYIMPGFSLYESMLEKLGKYKTGKSCLYLKSLADVDMNILEQLMIASLQEMKRLHPD